MCGGGLATPDEGPSTPQDITPTDSRKFPPTLNEGLVTSADTITTDPRTFPPALKRGFVTSAETTPTDPCKVPFSLDWGHHCGHPVVVSTNARRIPPAGRFLVSANLLGLFQEKGHRRGGGLELKSIKIRWVGVFPEISLWTVP